MTNKKVYNVEIRRKTLLRRHLWRHRRRRPTKIITAQSTDKISAFTSSSFASSRFRLPTSSTNRSPPCSTSRPEVKRRFRKSFLSTIRYPKTSTMTSSSGGRRRGFPTRWPRTVSAARTRSQFCVAGTTAELAAASSAAGARLTPSRCRISACRTRSGSAIGATSSSNPSSRRFQSRSAARRRTRRGTEVSAWCRSRPGLSNVVQHNQ